MEKSASKGATLSMDSKSMPLAKSICMQEAQQSYELALLLYKFIFKGTVSGLKTSKRVSRKDV